MLRGAVCFGLAMIIGLNAFAEDRKKPPPGTVNAVQMQFKASNSSNKTVFLDCICYPEKGKGIRQISLTKLKPFSDTSGSAAVFYDLRNRQLKGFDARILASSKKVEAEYRITFNSGAATNLPASGFINPNTEFLEVFVYDDSTGKLFMNVFTRKKT